MLQHCEVISTCLRNGQYTLIEYQIRRRGSLTSLWSAQVRMKIFETNGAGDPRSPQVEVQCVGSLMSLLAM
jgi:hypothetical protein